MNEFINAPENSKRLTAKQFEILSPQRYLEDFKLEVDEAIRKSSQDKDRGEGHRVLLQAMSVRFFGKPKEMFGILRNAVGHRIKTDINADCYDENDTVMNIVKTAIKPRNKFFGNIEDSFVSGRDRFIRGAGAKINRLNPRHSLWERINPTVGRNHIKISVVDNVAWMGGMNITEAEFSKYEDFTVKITDPRIVGAIANQFWQVNENRPKNNYEVECTDKTTLLVDNGNGKESIILKRAIEAVNRAQKQILLVTQFVPEGELLEALHNAYKRGVKLVCLQSDPKADDILGNTLNAKNRLIAKLHPIPLTILPNTKVHAKLLIADDTAFFGSHNFSDTGVKSRTEEMDLKTTEPTLVNNLKEYFQRLQNKI
jgi:phosphatidylserine/phosphatidylglycerophosphate/cardiolipin synthase-like enzyme